ncbi:MAG: cytochrome c3 family protein [Planctomycetota bacterium]
MFCGCPPNLEPAPPSDDGPADTTTPGDDASSTDQPNPPADPDDPAFDGNPADCLSCHDPAVWVSSHGGEVVSPTSTYCHICHDSEKHELGSVHLRNLTSPDDVIVLSSDPARDPTETEKVALLCSACHTRARFVAHTTMSGWSPSCTACHDVHATSADGLALVRQTIFNYTLTVDKPVEFTARTGPGSFSDGVGANDGVCQVCHTTTRYHRHDGTGAPHYEGADCTTCHPHESGFIPTGGTSCVACHSAPQGTRPAVVNADGSGGHHLADDVLSDSDCLVCHELSAHQQGDVRLWDDPNQPSSVFVVTADPAQLTDFCTACHDDGEPIACHTTGTDWNPVCAECHAVHEPNNVNLSLVTDVIYNRTLAVDKPVVFTARTGPGSFSDGVGANDGVCQVCHTDTRHHRHDGTGIPHHAGSDCAACHDHESGFIPTGGTSCIACHVFSQGGRRPIVDEFALVTHHVDSSSLTDGDCVVCHEISNHPAGSVRLRNVDHPDDPAEVIELSGDPLSDANEAARLEPFCLACHDTDGAGGTTPFSDGRTPPPIDADLWSAASHSASPTTCFGDGATFGCHASGHGSLKVSLLAPWDASQPGVPGDPLREEEGLCYSCHDADGPGASDIQSQFEFPTHHNVSALDQTDGSRVECLSCHDPHTLNTATPLRDPDSGDTWLGTGEAFCLTCHDGTTPPGVSFPPAAPGTGYDKSAFIGTTHDTTTGGNSCRHCHRVHGSPHLAMLRASYVVADYNEYLPGTDDYAACWQCHIENRVLYQMNAFQNRHSNHVVDYASPCIICHDVHAGFEVEEPGLIDFAYPVARGYDIEFLDGYDGASSFWINAGQDRGYCAIRCHGAEHSLRHYVRHDLTTIDCLACH